MAEQTAEQIAASEAAAAAGGGGEDAAAKAAADKAASDKVAADKVAADKTAADAEKAAFDKQFRTVDGAIDETKIKEYNKSSEKRILDLRKIVSRGVETPKDKTEYFQDYAPPAKFAPFFAADAKDAKEMGEIKGVMSDLYHNIALTKEQANAVTNALCGIMEGVGAFDTRTYEDKVKEANAFIAEQKKRLGPEAEALISESKTFIDNVPGLNPEEKNIMRELIDTKGAGFVSLVHKIKGMFGQGSGHVPVDLATISGLASDSVLKAEYLDPKTKDSRRQEISNQRYAAGRTTRLMDAE